MFLRRLFRTGDLLLVLCLVGWSVQASPELAGIEPDTLGLPIARIIISGNERTQEAFLLKWTGLGSGQVLSQASLNYALQELHDRGLFREIAFSSLRREDATVDLFLQLREKRYTLLVPRASRNNEGDIKAGFRLRMNNIQGADRTLEALIQEEKRNDGDEGEELRIKYEMPLLDRPYDLEWEAERSIDNTEVEDFENVQTTDLLSMSVQRDWHVDYFSNPITVQTGLILEEIDLEEPYPESLNAIESGTYNRLKLAFILDRVHRDRYRRFGSRYAVTFERGFDWLGSDFDSNAVTFEVRGYRPINPYDNIDYRLVFSASHDSPFDSLRYGLGGASTVRGLEDFDESGDARIFTNIEYVFAYRKRPNLRHTLFIDIGNVWRDLNSIDLSEWQYTLGTGFRWKIEAFVKTDLFLDYGYDFENDEGKLYGGTSLNF